VAVLRALGCGGARKRPDGHDWLEVTELVLPDPEPEPEPVEVLVAPELVEPVESDEPVEPDDPVVPDDPLDPLEPVEPLEVVAPVAPVELLFVAVAAWVTVLRASAGSCPVTSTTVMSIHTARNSATDPPITRARTLRTRARRASLSLIPSCLVMVQRIGRRHSNGV
jgi:hypothetical protein